MNILILGSGGREHALSWKIAQSPLVNNLFIAPGNAGTGLLGENLDIELSDFEGIKHAILEYAVTMLVIGPEDPLVNGIRAYLESDAQLKNLLIIGPSAQGAALEGSKDYAKRFMMKYGIPTAAYQTFRKGELREALEFLRKMNPPYVLKADGLAAGKGVLIPDNLKDAEKELELMLDGKFGDASSSVVIEEFLEGIEMSAFVLTDGKDYVLLPEAKDYKRIGEGDTGLNTGGMGAVSPVPFARGEFLSKVEEKVIKPTIKGIQMEGIDYKGFIFFGLINVKGEPFVIEYNVRLGDPETEVVIPRIKSDIVPLFIACAKGEIKDFEIEIDNRAACTVMLVSGGYPEKYEKGIRIEGLEQQSESIVFHAGTALNNGIVLTNGGRVISVTSYGENHKEALQKSYDTVKKIKFDKMYYRKDIGKDV